MRVLVTGSRKRVPRDRIYTALSRLGENTTIVVGDASGVDTYAKECAERFGYELDRHKADWNQYGNAAGPIRNQAMVDSGADICIAFPAPNSRGTKDCMERAQRAGIPVIVIEVNV